MAIEQWILYTLPASIIGCLVIPFCLPKTKSVIVTVIVIANSVFSSIPAFGAIGGQMIEIVFSNLGIFGDIPLRIDPLAAWFILIVNLTCINGTI